MQAPSSEQPANIINRVAVSVYIGLTSVCPLGPGWALCALHAVHVQMGPEHQHASLPHLCFFATETQRFPGLCGRFISEGATFRHNRQMGSCGGSVFSGSAHVQTSDGSFRHNYSYTEVGGANTRKPAKFLTIWCNVFAFSGIKQEPQS